VVVVVAAARAPTGLPRPRRRGLALETGLEQVASDPAARSRPGQLHPAAADRLLRRGRLLPAVPVEEMAVLVLVLAVVLESVSLVVLAVVVLAVVALLATDQRSCPLPEDLQEQ